MIANAVECLDTQVEGLKNDIGAPDSMVVATGEECVERVFAGMTAWSVATVVAKGDRFGECNIEAKSTRHRRCNLGHLKRVGEPSSLMIVRKDEDLRLAGQATKSGGVKDPITISFETGAELVRCFLDDAIAPASPEGCSGAECLGCPRLTLFSSNGLCADGRWRGITVGEHEIHGRRRTMHGRDPFLLPDGSLVRSGVRIGRGFRRRHGRILPYR